jgi:hypothetical protein
MQFEKLSLQQGSDVRTHAVWEPATAAGQLPCSGACMHAARQQNYPAVGCAGSLVIWTPLGGRNFRATLQSCNGIQAVMSALEAFVLAGKCLNAFSVLFIAQFGFFHIPVNCVTASAIDDHWKGRDQKFPVYDINYFSMPHFSIEKFVCVHKNEFHALKKSLLFSVDHCIDEIDNVSLKTFIASIMFDSWTMFIQRIPLVIWCMLVRSAPTTFYNVDVDDFSSVYYTKLCVLRLL